MRGKRGTHDSLERSSEDAWLHLGILIGTIQRHECRNDDLRLVFREFPILRPGSTPAARATLASRAQGHYEAIHGKLLGADGPFDLDRILAVARSIGLDAERLARDMENPSLEAPIERNAVLANAPGVWGTPALVIGDGMMRGGCCRSRSAQPSQMRGSRRRARGMGAAPTDASSVSSGSSRGQRRRPRRVVRGYDRGGSTMMRPRPRRSR